MERFIKSAQAARLPLPFPGDADANITAMSEVVRATCTAAGKPTADVRFWLTAGPGNLGVTPDGCEPGFYVLVFGGLPMPAAWARDGIAEASVHCSEVPLKPKLLAELKSNNYMLNALTAMCAKDKGGTFGIGVDATGLVRESCVLNVVMVTRARTLRTPPFDNILAGTTVRRAMQLATSLVTSGELTCIAQGDIRLEDLYTAQELFLLAGDTHAFPITSLDGKQIGDGRIGHITQQITRLLEDDAENGDECHEELPELRVRCAVD